MSDIADKIYAATGLTLNAEAAAKIGHMIRLARQEAADEIEKLRAESEKLATSNHAYLSNYQEAVDEIEKLRAALKTARRAALEEAAWECEGNFDSEMRGYGEYFAAAIRALGEKECKETES
jgi:hypothetical protein